VPRNVKLLLTDNVESLGIVGDVVNVRTGYARNFLLPRNLATQPSEEKVKALAAKRVEAEKMVASLRKQREETSGKLQGVEITLVRSCNDQGHLYASITQQDVAAALVELGHMVKPRDVRISQVMKRVDHYDVHVKLDSDLDSTIKLHVQADRKLDLDRHHEEAHHEGGDKGGDKGGEKSADAGEKAAGAEESGEERRSDRRDRKPRADRADRPKAEEKPEFVKGSFTKVAAKSESSAAKSEKPAKSDKPEKGGKGKAKG